MLLTDLLRRAAQFDAAYVTCKDGLAERTPALAGVLRYEESLIVARDAAAHTFAEVPEGVKEYNATFRPAGGPTPEEEEAERIAEAKRFEEARAEQSRKVWDKLSRGDTKKSWPTPWDDGGPWLDKKGGK